MKLFFFTLILFVSAAFIPSTAYACSCGTGDAPVEFNRAKAVFIGRMLGGTEKFTNKYSETQTEELESGSVRFAIQESFKGDLSKEVVIEVASMRGTSCGDYGLKRGEIYLVYAYARESKQDSMYTGVCTRTSVMTNKYLQDDLNFLRSLPAPGTGGNLEGRIWIDSRATSGGGAEPLSNVKLRIRGEDGSVKIVTSDRKGEFELKGLKAGTYKVEPELPDIYALDDDVDEVQIDDRGTGVVGIEAYFAGSVSGRAVDKTGLGYDHQFFHFESTDGKKNVYGHSEGENGEFVISGVPPGEYVLFMELRHDDYQKNKKYYYPGTFDRNEAKPIKVALKAKVTELKFVLPDEYRVHTIEGEVFWANGKPASGVEVNLLCPTAVQHNGFTLESGATSTESDESGRFSLQGFEGVTYWLEARGHSDGSELHSPSKKIQVSGNVSNLKVLLSEKGFSGAGCR